MKDFRYIQTVILGYGRYSAIFTGKCFNLFYVIEQSTKVLSMTSKAIRLNIGSIFPKGPGKIYFYRYVLSPAAPDLRQNIPERLNADLKQIFQGILFSFCG